MFGLAETRACSHYVKWKQLDHILLNEDKDNNYKFNKAYTLQTVNNTPLYFELVWDN